MRPLKLVFGCLCVGVVVSVVSAALAEPLPRFAKAQWGSDRFGVATSAFAVGVSQRLAVATDLGHVRLWDTAQQRLLWEVHPTPSALASLAFGGADGLVAITANNDALLLSTRDGHEVRRFPIQPCNKPCEVTAALATDTLLLTAAKGSDSDEATLRLWSLTNGKLLQSRTLPALRQLMLSPDGGHVAWLTSDAPSAFLASTSNLERAVTLSGCEPSVVSDFEDLTFHHFPVFLLFSPDGLTLAQVDQGKDYETDRARACFWDVAGGLAKDFRFGVSAVEASDDNKVSIQPDSVPTTALFSPDGKYLRVSYDLAIVMREVNVKESDVVMFDAKTGKTTFSAGFAWGDNAHAAWLSGVGAVVPFVPYGQNAVHLIHSREEGAGVGFPSAEFLASHHAHSVVGVSASHDGGLVASTDMAGKTLIWSQSARSALHIKADGPLLFDPAGGLLHFEPAHLPTSDMDCSTDPRPGDIGLWNLNATTRLSLQHDPKLMVRAALRLPDGEVLTCREQHAADEAGCSDYPTDAVQGVFERRKPDGAVAATYDKARFHLCARSQGVSVGSQRAVVADLNRESDEVTARVIDLSSGAVLMDLPRVYHWDHTALSPDGKHVALIDTADGVTHIKPFVVEGAVAQTPILVQAPSNLAYRATYPAVVYAPDSRALVHSDGLNITVRAVGSAATVSLRGHTGPVTALAFSGDGQTLFSAQSEGTLYAWDWAAISAALAP